MIHTPTPDAEARDCATAAQHARLAEKAFHPSRWRDPSPARPGELIRLKRQRRCAPTPRVNARFKEIERAAKARHSREYRDRISPPGAAWLRRVRACESGSSGGYRTNTGNGFYGAYQFDLSTWASVGGRGLPSAAPPREQDYRAARLYRSRGSSPWPVCG